MLYDQSDQKPNGRKEGFKKVAYGGTVTKGVQKRLGAAIDVFLQTTDERTIYNTVSQRYMSFRCGFMTLTISDYCTWTADKCYTSLLKPFLRVMKDKHGVNRYIWKYELQERGNVHYHVLIDQFVEYDKIRNAWNRVQHRNRLTDTYAKTYGHFNPNSTDIHKVQHIDNLGAYLAKYLMKEEQKVKCFHEGFPALFYDRVLKGKVWDCSTDLKRRRFSSQFVWENNDRLQGLLATGEASVVHLDKCTVVKCKHPEKLLTEDQQIDYNTWKYVF